MASDSSSSLLSSLESEPSSEYSSASRAGRQGRGAGGRAFGGDVRGGDFLAGDARPNSARWASRAKGWPSSKVRGAYPCAGPAKLVRRHVDSFWFSQCTRRNTDSAEVSAALNTLVGAAESAPKPLNILLRSGLFFARHIKDTAVKPCPAVLSRFHAQQFTAAPIAALYNRTVRATRRRVFDRPT